MINYKRSHLTAITWCVTTTLLNKLTIVSVSYGRMKKTFKFSVYNHQSIHFKKKKKK